MRLAPNCVTRNASLSNQVIIIKKKEKKTFYTILNKSPDITSSHQHVS